MDFVHKFVIVLLCFKMAQTATVLESIKSLNLAPGPSKKDASAATDFLYDTTECGISKGCYLSPQNCVNAECETFISWKEEGDDVFFEFSQVIDTELGGDQWVAFGFTDEPSMADVSLIACLRNETTSRVVSSFNYIRSNEILDDPILGLHQDSLSISYSGDRIECSMKRMKKVDPSLPDADKFYDLSNLYLLQTGSGPLHDDGGIGRHRVDPITTTSRIDISTVSIVGGFHISPLLKAHACLMIAAWVIMGGIGMLVARYFKGAWELEIAGIKFWFWVHRTTMQLVVALTAAGFIIIFVYVKDFSQMGISDLQNSHPVIGIIVMLLTLINPVMALFRPGPGTQSRMIFNLVHRVMGESGRILAVVNIITGFYLPQSRLFTEQWMVWVTVGLVVFHCLLEVLLYLSTFTLKGDILSIKTENYDLADDVDPLTEITERKFTLQTGMLFFYGVVMMGFSVWIFAEIGMK